MEQHEIDTFIAMAQRQHGDDEDPNYWAVVAMKYAYNLGVDHGEQAMLKALEDDQF